MASKYDVVKAWRKANPLKVAEQARAYAKRHPETNKRAKAKYREKNIDAIRERDRLLKKLKRKQNPEDQRRRSQAYLERQRALRIELAGREPPKVCEVCGEFHVRIVFDHCHERGHFRGWLCDRCNRVLGLVYDSPRVLKLLAEYLERDRGRVDDQAS